MLSPAARHTVGLASLWIFGLVVGVLLGRAAVARAQDPYAAIERFARIMTLIERNYSEEVDEHLLVEAAIEGMSGSLDEHTTWMSGDELGLLTTPSGGVATDVGLGLRAGLGGAVVIDVAAGSPAALEGLQPGDILLEIDGAPTAGLGEDELSLRLAGERGAAVALTVVREGWAEPKTISAVRDEVRHASVHLETLEGDITYARVTSFAEGVAGELGLGLDTRASAKGLILDLRDNPGGLLSEAVAVADLFLDGGRIVSIRIRGIPDEVYDAASGTVSSVPMVILINGGTASASEVVAAALQERGRATVVGTRSWGKGSIQHLYRQRGALPAALKLTVGHYFTPSGQPVAAREGRAPDVEVTDGASTDVRAELRSRLGLLPVPAVERAALLDLLDRVDDAPVVAAVAWEVPVAIRDDPPVLEALSRLRP